MTKGERTRQQLMEKAANLFLKGGYEKTTMRDLAKAVKIQAPAIYNHFKSKKDILRAIDQDSWQKFRETILAEVKKVGDPEEKIKIYIRNMIKYQILLGEIVFIVDDSISPRYKRRKESRQKEIFYLLRDILRELAEAKGIRNPINSNLAAFSIIALSSRIYKWYRANGELSVHELADQTIRLFFHGFYGSGDFVSKEGPRTKRRRSAG